MTNAPAEVGVNVRLNGCPVVFGGNGSTSLLRALRDSGLTGTTGGCEQGECGSCSVLLDDILVCACLVLVGACEGASITTIEAGVAPDLATALADHGAVQCGFCTPGFGFAAEAVMRARTPLKRPQVVEALAGNLCRCTGYQGIIAAVLETSARRNRTDAE